jgi:hypothetical protein
MFSNRCSISSSAPSAMQKWAATKTVYVIRLIRAQRESEHRLPVSSAPPPERMEKSNRCHWRATAPTHLHPKPLFSFALVHRGQRWSCRGQQGTERPQAQAERPRASEVGGGVASPLPEAATLSTARWPQLLAKAYFGCSIGDRWFLVLLLTSPATPYDQIGLWFEAPRFEIA